KAEWYEPETRDRVRCTLCPHYCLLGVGERGLCRSRMNIDGVLRAVNYGRSVALALDNIEKKPLYHFFPGSRIVSLGPNSCNLSCRFCQNFSISQEEASTANISPAELASIVHSRSSGCPQVAFTYTEPLTWYEYILDFARQYPEIRIVLVTNGYINSEPLARLLPHVAAMNIDLKSFREDFYHSQCGGSLDPVLASIKSAYAAGVHLELTNLLIPGLNNKADEIRQMAQFIAHVDERIPLHISAYHPDYLAEEPATTHDDVIYACRIASEYLKHVYAGNVADEQFTASYCPNCSHRMISRNWFSVEGDLSGSCASCGQKIYGVFTCSD
ncbi:MAG TPA: AmmeMemoRadiSam system radical SAM enzyme, partial [Candidatus Cloacimonadota bacterium]|nr:AmmeMemoRadiSam system radical SAM enzyme [Candidatus Cloacimonadota bacterium]